MPSYIACRRRDDKMLTTAIDTPTGSGALARTALRVASVQGTQCARDASPLARPGTSPAAESSTRDRSRSGNRLPEVSGKGPDAPLRLRRGAGRGSGAVAGGRVDYRAAHRRRRAKRQISGFDAIRRQTSCRSSASTATALLGVAVARSYNSRTCRHQQGSGRHHEEAGRPPSSSTSTSKRRCLIGSAVEPTRTSAQLSIKGASRAKTYAATRRIVLAEKYQRDKLFAAALGLLDGMQPKHASDEDLRGMEWQVLRNLCNGPTLQVRAHGNGADRPRLQARRRDSSCRLSLTQTVARSGTPTRCRWRLAIPTGMQKSSQVAFSENDRQIVCIGGRLNKPREGIPAARYSPCSIKTWQFRAFDREGPFRTRNPAVLGDRGAGPFPASIRRTRELEESQLADRPWNKDAVQESFSLPYKDQSKLHGPLRPGKAKTGGGRWRSD